MKIRVPKRLTKTIEEWCQEINPGHSPVYINVDRRLSSGNEEDCFANVARKMAAEGGSFQFGWAIWEWADLILEAEFWAVWVDERGQWLDVTPRSRGDKLLFLPDDRITPQGKPVDSILKPIFEHPLVVEYLQVNKTIWQITDQMTEAGKNDLAVCEAVAPYIEHKSRLEKDLESLAGGIGRNDRCTCGSGKKFKNCCGH